MNKQNLEQLIKNIKLVIDNNDYTPLKKYYDNQDYQKFIQSERERIFIDIQNILKDYL